VTASLIDPPGSDERPPPTYAQPFWLSHHRHAQRHACFAWGGVHVCARCLGTYPVLFAVLALQLHRPMAPLHLSFDPWLLFALPLPAVIDWSVGQLTAWRGLNGVRLLTGGLLGVALGRALYIHMRHPGTAQIYVFGLAGVAVAGIVWGLRVLLGLGRSGAPGSVD